MPPMSGTGAPRPGLLTRRQAALGLLAAVPCRQLAGCGKPEEEILPYVDMPERLVPGVPAALRHLVAARRLSGAAWSDRLRGTADQGRGQSARTRQASAPPMSSPRRGARALRPRPVAQPARRGGAPHLGGFLAALLPRLARRCRRADGAGLRLLTGPDLAHSAATDRRSAAALPRLRLARARAGRGGQCAARRGAGLRRARSTLCRAWTAPPWWWPGCRPARPRPRPDPQRPRLRRPAPGARGRQRVRRGSMRSSR